MERPLFVYLEPRPIHAQLGHSNYITLDMSLPCPFEYVPYIPNYSSKPLPPTATDLYSLCSPTLHNAIQEFLNSPIARSPPPSDLQNTSHFTAVRYRDTSAHAVLRGLCMQQKFETYLLMLALGTVYLPLPKSEKWQEALSRIRSQGDVDISADKKAVAILVWSSLIDKTQAQIIRWRVYSEQWRQVTETNPFFRNLLRWLPLSSPSLSALLSSSASMGFSKCEIQGESDDYMRGTVDGDNCDHTSAARYASQQLVRRRRVGDGGLYADI